MQIRTLGKDLKVSAVGLGCMGMSHAYGAPVTALDEALGSMEMSEVFGETLRFRQNNQERLLLMRQRNYNLLVR